MKKTISIFLLPIKLILFIPLTILKFFWRGFQTLSLFLSRGFYFYIEKIFTFLKIIIPFKFMDKIIAYYHNRREDPSHIVVLIIWFLSFIYIFDTFYIDNSNAIQASIEDQKTIIEEKPVEKVEPTYNQLLSKDLNLYRMYGKYSLDEINIASLKEKNEHTVAWLIVEGTNINYPIVKTTDNDYYLNHSYDKSYSTGGWTFMDYRNDNNMNDSNTIFYGHNLLNKTSFGSISNIFSSNKNEIKIKVITDKNIIYTYSVFSGYIIEPEVYYLQTNFYNNTQYQEFLNTISNRNILNVNTSVTINDKIITLSTCTDDNKGRKVIHAKLMNIE